MDFQYHYSDEQEQFRQQVRRWIGEHVPAGARAPGGILAEMDEETFQIGLQIRRKLGEKGWLAPTYPKEYGGAGLSPEHETILREELEKARVPVGFSNDLILPVLLVWGTEEQKQRFLKPLLEGRIRAFQNFSEPGAGSDLASLQSKAVRDGDDWLITGQKTWVSGQGDPDILFGPIMTDPDAPRHRNLGYFLIPFPSQGLQLQRLNLLNGHDQNFVFMDNVRVPGDHLIGGDHQGWQVAQTTLEIEHGAAGSVFPRDEGVEQFLGYVKETKRNGGILGHDPVVQQRVVDNYIDAHINELLSMRNYWMYTQSREMSYEGSQSALYGKEYALRNSNREREVLGFTALLNQDERRAPFDGEIELRQRGSLVIQHPGGTAEVQRVIIARRIGISRTKERAAVTPSTMQSQAGG